MKKKKSFKILVIIPAYNEESMIAQVIEDVPKKIEGIGNVSIVVIDDGSRDNTYAQAKATGVRVLRHIINRGLGASLATGFSVARQVKADIVVTFDADGQHRGKDITRLIKPIVKRKADVVIGSRLRKKTSMPRSRYVINLLSNILTFILFGIWTSDSQSGLRAFSREAVEKIKLHSQRMEVSSEIFKEIKRNNLSMVEVPIPAIYTEYSLKKGQRLSNAYNVLWKLLIRYIR